MLLCSVSQFPAEGFESFFPIYTDMSAQHALLKLLIAQLTPFIGSVVLRWLNIFFGNSKTKTVKA